MSQFALNQSVSAGVQLEGSLMLNQNMQQALHVLQLPLSELNEWITETVDENPALEFVDHYPKVPLSKGKVSGEALVEKMEANEPSLFDMLMEQVRERLSGDLVKAAEAIVGNLNAKGFFEGESSSLLELVQTFDPPGIAARNVQESLLIQLRRAGKELSLAYELIKDHYEALIHRKFHLIEKEMGLTSKEITVITKRDIAPLNPYPGLSYRKALPAESIIADIIAFFEHNKWHLSHPKEYYPSFRIIPKYLHFLKHKLAAKEGLTFLKQHITSGKWLIYILERRTKILERITRYLLEKQGPYLLRERDFLLPLTLQEVAESLDLHESTLSRALSHKYIDTPIGVLPFRFFFNTALKTTSGISISTQKAKQLLVGLIAGEDKSNPLPDEILSNLLKNQGILCSRRTVAKYRSELDIPSTHARNKS